jgi:nitrogen fixation-related uncharacterized protein
LPCDLPLVKLIWAVDSGQYDGDVEENGRIALESESVLTKAAQARKSISE